MYNLLTAIISSYIILQSSGQATPGYLRPGDTCATIAGPTQVGYLVPLLKLDS